MARPDITEAEVQAACLEFLAAHRIFHWRQNQGAIPLPDGGYRRFNGMKGQSDIIGICPDGRFLAIEVKRLGKNPTKEQDEFLEHIANNGGVATWVSSVDELEADLREAGII